MKYCPKCGTEMADESSYCPKCGAWQSAEPKQEPCKGPTNEPVKTNKGIVTANKVLLIILCASLCLVLVFAIVCTVFSAAWVEDLKKMLESSQENYGAAIGFAYWMFANFGVLYLWLCALPLAWVLPMTVHYFKKVKVGEPVSIAFKICMLIFAHTLVGIFMLCFEPHADDVKG